MLKEEGQTSGVVVVVVFLIVLWLLRAMFSAADQSQ